MRKTRKPQEGESLTEFALRIHDEDLGTRLLAERKERMALGLSFEEGRQVTNPYRMAPRSLFKRTIAWIWEN